MKRLSLSIAALVFFFSTTAELAAIQMMHGSVLAWMHYPRRLAVFVTSLAINLLNSLIAGLLVYWIQKKTLLLRQSQQEKREMTKYLNHHVRNALCSLQYATYATKDKQAIKICDAAIARIVRALVDAERSAERNLRPNPILDPREPTTHQQLNDVN
jgi:hypothetical protein